MYEVLYVYTLILPRKGRFPSHIY